MSGYSPAEQLAIALREFIASTPECDDGPDCRLCSAESLLHLLAQPADG